MSSSQRAIRNLPIKRKVSFAILVTCGTALAVTAAAIFITQLITFRQEFTRNLEAIGTILGHNSAAALSFENRKDAQEILAAVRAKAHIVQASIDLPNGSKLAAIEGTGLSLPRELPRADGCHFVGRHLVLNQPIMLAGERMGTLHLISDYQTEYHRSLRLYSGILAVVLVASVLLALLLASRLQRLVADPILRLAGTAQRVAEKNDYSLRAEKLATDEVGRLTDAFNEMLARIEGDDAALRRAKETLEAEIGEHKRSKEALQNSEHFTRSLVESLPQNIIRKDLDGRFTFVNEFYCHTLGKPMDQILGKTDDELYPPEMAAKFRRDDERVLASGRQFEAVEENRNESGNRVFVQVIKTPLFDANHRPAGLQVIFWDVTERKEAEAAVEKLNKQLLLTSRQAGMAEVATGVLHNVGNVLNSVNVSANVIEGRLRQSRVHNLGRAMALIREHKADLARFLTDDVKGKMLPGYLETLADHLAAEHTEILRETDLLTKNIEHIKEIVAMQQTYAKLYGVTEKVQAASLVEDAVRMNLGAFERHGISIVREFAEVPPVLADRHKVLQILVNLMRNAKYALDEQGPSEKRLVVSITAQGDRRVVISLRDNGIGIPPDNLTRIFGHGFTTKRDGHGFGLHSGALAAKEMGGQLTAFSEGAGKGATFSLELPAAGVQTEEEPSAADRPSLHEAISQARPG